MVMLCFVGGTGHLPVYPGSKLGAIQDNILSSFAVTTGAPCVHLERIKLPSSHAGKLADLASAVARLLGEV